MMNEHDNDDIANSFISTTNVSGKPFEITKEIQKVHCVSDHVI